MKLVAQAKDKPITFCSGSKSQDDTIININNYFSLLQNDLIQLQVGLSTVARESAGVRAS